MNSLQDLWNTGSNILGQASEHLAPAASLAASTLRAGAKAVNKSLKENISAFGGETHVFEDPRDGQRRSVNEVNFIAEGAFGAVVKVVSSSGETFAVKKIACAEGTQVASSYEAAEREAKILCSLPAHPNIIRCFGYATDRSPGGSSTMKLLLELCSGGHLLDFMDSKNGVLSPKEVMLPFVQITEAVRHLHSQRPAIQHRDLKVENVLKGNDGNWKLCDFGSCSSIVVPPQEMSRSELMKLQEEIDKSVTMLYRPPEMADVALNYREGYIINDRVDIWMLGCILYTLAFYRHPFQDNATAMAIWNAKYFIPQEHDMARSQKLCALIHLLLAADPKDRPSAETLLKLCRDIGKIECAEFIGSMPPKVQKKIQQHQKLYGARQSREPPPEWNLTPNASSTATMTSGGATGSRRAKPEASPQRDETFAHSFDLRFALAEQDEPSRSYGSDSRGKRRGYGDSRADALPVAGAVTADLLSFGSEPTCRSSAVGNAGSGGNSTVDDLFSFNSHPSEPSRAKSAPAVTVHHNDFDLSGSGTPSLQHTLSTPAGNGFASTGFDFADFSSAPAFPSSDIFPAFDDFNASSSKQVPVTAGGSVANLLDL